MDQCIWQFFMGPPAVGSRRSGEQKKSITRSRKVKK